MESYRNYLKRYQHLWKGVLALSSFALVHCCIVALTRELGLWATEQTQAYHISVVTNTPYDYDNTYYMISTSLLILLILIGIYLKGLMMTQFIIEINTNLHATLLHSVSRATVGFFDETPVGQVLSRFSTSLGALDSGFPNNVYMMLEGVCSNIFFLIYICWSNFMIVIPSLLVIFGFLKMRTFYSKPMRDLKKLEITSRSPMVSEIAATVHGLVIIRVYKQGVRFLKNFLDYAFNNSKVLIYHQRMERSLAMSLFSLLYILVMIGLYAFLFKALEYGIDPGLFGLALYYLIAVGSNSIMTTRQSLQVAISMQNAENILQYFDLPKEGEEENETLERQLTANNQKWPPRGEISFNKVYMKYPNTSKYALNGLDFVISPGSKIGIVGRTGAGKTSIIQILFRMVEIESMPGSSIQIDNVDIRKIGLNFLRKNLCIIPQTPVIFTGKIRKNLDPFKEYSDDQLWDALEQVKLKDYVDGLKDKLNTKIGISSSVFSAGQKQLVCLARIILKKKKIIVFDEATANVDYETDAFVQEQIQKIFKDCTIITIAHRLTTIANYDKIMVLEKGRILEYDHPYLLLVENEGDRKMTNKDGLFARMVNKTEEKIAMKVFDMALSAYEQKVKKV